MRKLPFYLFVILLVVATCVAVVVSNRPGPSEGDQPVTLEQALMLFPEAEKLRIPPGDSADLVWVEGDGGEHLGSLILSCPHCNSIAGYAGPTPLLIALDPEGEILSVELLDSLETPSYVRRLRRAGFLERWKGMHWQQAAREDENEVDAVSGVTMTCMAIARTLRHRLSMMDPEISLAPPPPLDLEVDPLDLGLVALTILGILLALLPRRFPRWARTVQQGLAVSFLGILTGSMFSLALFGGWLSAGRINGSLGLLVVTGAALLVPVLSRRNFYCHFLCPFGALQDLIFKLTPWSMRPPRKVHRLLKQLRYGMLTAAALLLLLGFAQEVNYIEPFSAFRPSAAGAAALSIAGVALFLSPFVCKPWCTYFCGAGAFLDLLRRPRLRRSRADDSVSSDREDRDEGSSAPRGNSCGNGARGGRRG